MPNREEIAAQRAKVEMLQKVASTLKKTFDDLKFPDDEVQLGEDELLKGVAATPPVFWREETSRLKRDEIPTHSRTKEDEELIAQHKQEQAALIQGAENAGQAATILATTLTALDAEIGATVRQYVQKPYHAKPSPLSIPVDEVASFKSGRNMASYQVQQVLQHSLASKALADIQKNLRTEYKTTSSSAWQEASLNELDIDSIPQRVGVRNLFDIAMVQANALLTREEATLTEMSTPSRAAPPPPSPHRVAPPPPTPEKEKEKERPQIHVSDMYDNRSLGSSGIGSNSSSMQDVRGGFDSSNDLSYSGMEPTEMEDKSVSNLPKHRPAPPPPSTRLEGSHATLPHPEPKHRGN